MYRLTYTVKYDVPGFACAGDIRTIQFATNHAFVCLREWRKATHIHNVYLEQWITGAWTRLDV